MNLPGFPRTAPGYNPYGCSSHYGPPPTHAMMQAMDANPALRYANPQLAAFDAATAGGMAFLQSELEKVDPKVREPLTAVTWQRDIDVKSGGGWVDHTSTFSVNYATAGPNQLGFIGGQTTQIPIIQADVAKDLYPVTNWAHVMKVTFIDLQKAQQAGRSLEDIYYKGIGLNWNKSLDLTTYLGWGDNAGLVNNANVTQSTVPVGAQGQTRWVNKTPNEILFDIGNAVNATWIGAQYDLSGMANAILIPPVQYNYIAETPVNNAAQDTILEWILKKNIAKNQGRDLEILPSRWCAGAGVGLTDRMVAYCRDEDRAYLDITVPMQRVMSSPSVAEGAYLTLYLGQIGVVKILAYQNGACIGYSDGI